MLNPFGNIPRVTAILLLASATAFSQNPETNPHVIEKWIQAVAPPTHAADTRIAIGGNEWLFIEIRQVAGKDCIFALKIKESELQRLHQTSLPLVNLPNNKIELFITSLKKLQTPLLPNFKYSNDLTEVYFASRSMMGSLLTYRGYIRDLPKLRAIVLSLFSKTELPTALQPDK